MQFMLLAAVVCVWVMAGQGSSLLVVSDSTQLMAGLGQFVAVQSRTC